MIGLELTPGRQDRPQPAPLAGYFAAGQGRSVALAAGPDGTVDIWTEIAPDMAACFRMDNIDPTTRLSWRETLIMALRSVYPVGEMVLSGTWSQLQSSGSGIGASYTGNRAISTSSSTPTATVAVDRAEPYDLWVCYTGRTAGAYCRVEIDGGQALLNELDDPAGLGFKAFATHAPTDLSRRQSVRVASGLTGPHVVTLRHGGTASPGGTALMLEAVAISASLGDPRILPPVWQPQTAYMIGDEVRFGGQFYAARATATSGTTGPTHTSGIASDGALDWRADNRSTYPSFVTIDYASEREYAARFLLDGVTTELGGQTHGNEPLASQSLTIDGTPWSRATAGNMLQVGNRIVVTETTTWQQQGGGAVADCVLTRDVAPGMIRHDVTVTGTGPVLDFDWLYTGMVPMVRWDGELRLPVVDAFTVGGSAPVALSGFAGVLPPNIEFEGTRRFGISATALGKTLLYGHESGAAPLPGNSVNQFDTFLRPNLNATNEGGGLDWQAKGYVKAAGGLQMSAGDVLGFYSRHILRIA